MSSIASYIRSGYPVIILGYLKTDSQNRELHAVCTVGFRTSPFSQRTSSETTITLEDFSSEILYIHDDNIGPSARFRIKTEKINNIIYPVLHLEAPNYNQSKEVNNYQIIPTKLVIATHNELRTSPDQLYSTGLNVVGGPLYYILRNIKLPIHMSLSTRFIKLTDYVHDELGRFFKEDPEFLSYLRLFLWEKVRPMSLHIGLVRIGNANPPIPLLDVLYDTTDSNLQLFTYIPFLESISKIIESFNLDFNKSNSI